MINARFHTHVLGIMSLIDLNHHKTGPWVTPTDTSMSLIAYVRIIWNDGLKSATSLLVLLGLHTSSWWESAASRGWELWNKDVELLHWLPDARWQTTWLYARETRRCSARALSLSLYLSMNIFECARLSMINKQSWSVCGHSCRGFTLYRLVSI